MMAVATLMSCEDHDWTTDMSDMSVDVSLAFSIPEMRGEYESRTRQVDSVVQISSDYYRGLKDVRIIPFMTSGSVTKEDQPFFFDANGRNEAGRVAGKPSELVPDAAFYYYPECSFWPGTASMLFYAKGANSVKVNDEAIPGTDKSYYGSTLMTGTDTLIAGRDNRTPELIRFMPEQIRPKATVDARAQALADYLTAIAKTEGWNTTEDAKLKALYLDFLHQDETGDYGILAGSSACVRAFVEELYAEVELRESDAALAEAIQTSIKSGATVDDEGHVALTTWNGTDLTGYPANIHMPAGTAALKWDGTAFQPQTKTTIETAITSTDRFVYPAELCYYGNSTIKTSRYEVAKTVYQKETTTWADILERYKTDIQVKSDTKSAAMVSPVQYGVARLSVKLKIMDVLTTPLLDANGDEVSFADTYYPLTAVIVGGQYPVGFDFKPETARAWPTDEERSQELMDQMLFVYDPQVKTKKTGTDSYDYYCLSSSGDVGNTNTLVLQTYEKKNVKVVLEFENRSGKKFMGHDGIVYPGTKFYLIGEVNPSTAGNVSDENKDRVFTQDFITTFMVKIESFENAYNVMPDLLAPRMEIGIEVPNWGAIRPVAMELQL